jgi:photosystem II stability/assembly factor-like uncharacterized protein
MQDLSGHILDNLFYNRFRIDTTGNRWFIVKRYVAPCSGATVHKQRIVFLERMNYAHGMKKHTLLFVAIFAGLMAACTTPTAVPLPEATSIPVVMATIVAQPTAVLQKPTLEPTKVPTESVSLSPKPVRIYQLKMVTNLSGWGLGGFSGEASKVLRTVDGAKTWNDMKLPGENGNDSTSSLLAGFFLNDQIAWVAPYMSNLPPAGEQTIWKTIDGGINWSKSILKTDALLEAFSISHIYFVDELDGWLMAHVGAGMNHDYIVIFHTTDGGNTWNSVVDPTNNDAGVQSCQKNGLVFSDAKNGWLTGTCNGVAAGVLLFHTQDAGKTWTSVILPSPQNHPGLYQDPNNVCGSQFPKVDGLNIRLEVVCKQVNASLDQPITVLNTSPDGGVSWMQQEIPGGVLNYLPENGLYVLSDKSSLSTDGGLTWIDLTQAPNGNSAQFIDAKTGWILSTTGEEIYQTLDGGSTWVPITPKIAE